MQNNYLRGNCFLEEREVKNSIGSILQQWRKQRRYSQLQLSLELGVSSKHVSFIETGRSMPSREMILKIGAFLLLPKREINRGLHAAGYAPVYTELPAEHGELKPVFAAIDQMIESHMPYPALVLNQFWDVVKVNGSAKKILFELGYSDHENLIEALIDDEPKTSKIINWHESVLSILARLRQEIGMMGGSDRLEELEMRLSARLPVNSNLINMSEKQVIPSTKFRVAEDELSLFSIISQLSTIQDVTVSELKVELMFPVDEATKAYFRKLE
ncbi:hypothetical protein MNBD_GAMMA18-63 [hydrothermal vent metagenome]|uniref:HTH cro/C1-type domain-containing protein n=1 Tax=hydrothermal vent metagenome TaxID=652676 RepID=A0A3B0Z276_9ZZZZ